MEKRRRSRIEAHFPVAVSAEGGKRVGRLVNASLKGLLVSGVGPLPKGGEVSAAITLGGGEEVTIRVNGRVVRSRGDEIALAIDTMDPESFGHLRNLVRLHSPDPDAIDDEIAVDFGPA